MDHTFGEEYVQYHAHLGFRPEPPRCWEVFARTPQEAVTCGRLCALSLHHGMGVKIKLGMAWMKAPEDVFVDPFEDHPL